MKAATVRRVEPTQHLYEGAPYTKSIHTDLRAKWADFFAYHSKPTTRARYQQEQLDEHNTRSIP